MNMTIKYQSSTFLRLPALFALLFTALLSIAVAETDEPLVNYYETPLQAVLTENAFAEHYELADVSLTQTLNRAESPNHVIISLTQSGFLDDSIEGTQEIYDLRLTEEGWIIDHKETLIKCYRGPDTEQYLEQICL